MGGDAEGAEGKHGDGANNGDGTAQHLIGIWFGVLAPAATPKDIVVRLNAEMVKVIQSLDFRRRMAEIGAQPIGNGDEQMAAQIRGETDKFARLVKEAKVVIE